MAQTVKITLAYYASESIMVSRSLPIGGPQGYALVFLANERITWGKRSSLVGATAIDEEREKTFL
jgi:hypothetical protein